MGEGLLQPANFALIGLGIYIVLVVAFVVGLTVFVQAVVRISHSFASIARACEQIAVSLGNKHQE